MFGVYSVIFGSGMIIGPISGGIFAEIGNSYDPEIGTALGLVFAVILLVVLSSIGTLFLEERAYEDQSQLTN